MGNNPADCGLQAQGKAARMLSAHTAEQTDSSGQRFKNHDRELRKVPPILLQEGPLLPDHPS